MAVSSRRRGLIEEHVQTVARMHQRANLKVPVTLFAEDYDYLEAEGGLKRGPEGDTRMVSTGVAVKRGPNKATMRG